MSSAVVRPAPLIRRLAAGIYDGLLVIALWFLVGFAALPFTGGEAVATASPVFTVILYTLTGLFFVVFWTHGGQTLGMRAWRLQVRRPDGGPVDVRHAVIRLILAVPSWGLMGIGVLAMYLDDRRRTLHDRFSDTEVIVAPPPKKPL